MALIAGVGVFAAAPAQADYTSDAAQCNQSADAVADAGGGGGNPVTNDLIACIKADIEAEQIEKADRNTFVNSLTTLLGTETEGAFNVMIFNDAENHTQNLSGVVLSTQFVYADPTTGGNTTYDVWIFNGGGTFTNQGDGGWLNWGMYGYFTAADGTYAGYCARGGTCYYPDRVITFTTPPQVGGHYLTTQVNGAKCVNDSGGGVSDGTPVSLWDCKSSAHERFYQLGFAQDGTNAAGGGPSMFVVNGKCLDDPGDNAANGTKVDLWQCTPGAASEQWNVQSDGTIRNAGNGKCLAMNGWDTTNGVQLIMWDCYSGQNNEQWNWTTNGSGTGSGGGGGLPGGWNYLGTTHGLGAAAASFTPSAGTGVIAGVLGQTNSFWELIALSNGRYEIWNGSGLVLTENTSSYLAELQPWSASAEQEWQVLPSGSGYQIRITDQDCLTYDEDFTALGVWTCDGSAPQQWTVSAAGS